MVLHTCSSDAILTLFLKTTRRIYSVHVRLKPILLRSVCVLGYHVARGCVSVGQTERKRALRLFLWRKRWGIEWPWDTDTSPELRWRDVTDRRMEASKDRDGSCLGGWRSKITLRGGWRSKITLQGEERHEPQTRAGSYWFAEEAWEKLNTRV